MAKIEIFAGRKEELKEFAKVLEDPRGQAIVVVGNRGMGKTWLVNRMAKMASEHPTLKCGWVRYEVTPTDSPDSTMATMMDDAYEAGRSIKEGFKVMGQNRQLWKSLVPVAELIGGTRGKALAELIIGFQRDKTKNTREQFIGALNVLSRKIGTNGRWIFIVDPEKEMAEKSDQTWAIVVKGLPEKIKLIFAQRSEDVLVGSEVIDGLDNVVRIPGKILDILSEEDVDELLNCRRNNLRFEISDLRKILRRYEGHPYAVGAALDLVEQGTKLEGLPKTGKPIEFAAKQWEKISEKGDEAIKLFEAYTVLEVAVPDDVVEYASKLDTTTRKRLQNDKYLRGLLRDEAGGKRTYHSILADYILGQMSAEEKKEYHKRAVEVYRGKLKKAKEEQTKPDELAAMRLPEHVWEAEGKEAFVYAFVNECFEPLRTLGLLDEAIIISEIVLEIAKKGSEVESIILGNLGLIYQTREELNKAEEMMRRALEINENLGSLEGIASDYGNLGVIYQKRGELDKAEEMYKKSLEISEKIGLLEVMASCYGNLGLIYRTIGELDKAEKMHRKSLDIDKKLGRPEGMADTYGNLGGIYEERGDLGKAKEYWGKARDLFKKIGMPKEVKKVEGWISNL